MCDVAVDVRELYRGAVGNRLSVAPSPGTASTIRAGSPLP